jgi:predicted outer membrane lipoprotein
MRRNLKSPGALDLCSMPGSVMDDNRARNGTLGAIGAILGVLVAIAFGIFLLAGGEHVGKKTVKSDADLPPIAGGKGK